MSARNAQLRKLLSGEDILMAPGAHDALTARIAEMCGFNAVYMTGAGTVNTQLGMPDHSIITLTEMVQNAARLVKAIYELFSEIRNMGTQKQMVDRMYTRKQLYELLD